MYNLVQSDDSARHQTFVRKPRRRSHTFVLRLTSMIDIFTILLIFLLKNFSAEGQILSTANDLTLPVSSAVDPAATTSVVTITPDWILVDGKPLESLKRALSHETLLLNNLFEDLKTKRILTESAANLDNRMAFRGEITIQGDENIPFEILKRVMFTCGQVGYNNILLAVNSTRE